VIYQSPVRQNTNRNISVPAIPRLIDCSADVAVLPTSPAPASVGRCYRHRHTATPPHRHTATTPLRAQYMSRSVEVGMHQCLARATQPFTNRSDIFMDATGFI
jgi:hypothetical protein